MLLKHPGTDRFSETPVHKVFVGWTTVYKDSCICDIFKKLLNHPLIVINQKNHDIQTIFDLIKKEILRIKWNCYIYQDEMSSWDIKDQNKLPELNAAKEFLEEFLVKIRFHSYQ